MRTSARAQRYLLLAFVGSLVICAAMGVFVIASDTRSATAWAILAITALFAAASILGLVDVVVWARRRWHPVGLVGLAFAIAAFALSSPVVWIECVGTWRVFGPGPHPYYDLMCRISGIAWIAAVAITIVAALSLAQLDPRYRWVRRWTIIVNLLLAAYVAHWVWNGRPLIDESTAFRHINVLFIILGCGSLAVPVLHRITTIRAREAVRTTDLRLSLTCPRCAHTQTVAVGRSRCVQCNLGFLLEIEEDLCPGCGYPLYQLSSGACPECGRRVTTSANIAPPGREPSSAPS